MLVIGHAPGELGREARGEGGSFTVTKNNYKKSITSCDSRFTDVRECVRHHLAQHLHFTSKETGIQKEDLYRTFLTIKIMILYKVSTMYIWYS